MAMAFSLGVPLLAALISVPGGRSALPSFLGFYLRGGGNVAGPLGLDASGLVSVSNGVVVLSGGEVGVTCDLLGGPRTEEASALGRSRMTSSNRLRVRGILGYRAYNFSQLDANRGDDVIRSQTYSKGSYLAPGMGLSYGRALSEIVRAEMEVDVARAVFFSESPLRITEVTARIGLGVEI